MAKIIFNTNTTKNMIENAPAISEGFGRGYLGMSGLGGECTRALWYSFRFAAPKIIPVRLKRIFERGDIEEERIIRDLKKAGIEVFRREGKKKIELTGKIGEKQEQLVGFAGHAKGHPDGRALGVIEAPKTEHLLEIKTMNERRFKNFQKNGVEVSDPVYYSQAQRYMGEMKLPRTLFISTNKNTEEREYERLYFDKQHFEDLKNKEFTIITSDVPVGDKLGRAHWKCKSCAFSDTCYDDAPPSVTCRSCEYVDLAMEGKWLCSLNNDKELTIKDQEKACRQYRRLF